MKAWESHSRCQRCLKTRTKDQYCAVCWKIMRRKPNKRTNWDQYFMMMADVARLRHTCPPRTPQAPDGVGAILVRDRQVLSTGYNGSVRGMAHCTDVGHMMENDHCVRTVHAEANAIVQAAKHGVRIDGATIYTTASPCWWCFKLIVNAGVHRIVYGELYRDDRITDFAKQARVQLVHCKEKHGRKKES